MRKLNANKNKAGSRWMVGARIYDILNVLCDQDKSWGNTEAVKVLFVSANREEINMPTYPLGLACVAEATKQAGHDVELLDLMGANDPSSVLEDAIHRFRPEVIGVSVRNIDDQDSKSPRFLLEQVRNAVAGCRRVSGAPVILGGAGYSIFPASALDYLGAKMGIQGEGEVSFPATIRRMQQGTDLSGIPGLHVSGLGLQGNRRLVKKLVMIFRYIEHEERRRKCLRRSYIQRIFRMCPRRPWIISSN
jgi:hypothetical protein